MIRFMTLLIALTVFSGCAIGPAPKMDTCLVNMNTRMFECKNHKGTKFNIPMNTKNPDNVKYLHNHISAPGHQVIDMFAWFNKAMTYLKNEFYNKAR